MISAILETIQHPKYKETSINVLQTNKYEPLEKRRLRVDMEIDGMTLYSTADLEGLGKWLICQANELRVKYKANGELKTNESEPQTNQP